MNRLMLLIPLCGVLLSGCAGTNSDFECNATTSDTCMTMEQANEKAKRMESASVVKADAVSLPRLADGNFRTPSVAAETPAARPVSTPVATAANEQKLLSPAPQFTAAREVKTVVPVSMASVAQPPRPLRLGEQIAALWIAPYIDKQDIYHQPSAVFFIIKPSAWGIPRIN